jgi:hypothetical protein
MNDEIKNLIETINKNLKELNENIPKLFSLIIKKEEENEGYTKFDFIEPLQAGKGFEKFLLEILDREGKKHGVKSVIKRNEKNEIVQLLLKGEEEHVQHVLNAAKWINKKISEKQKQENKTIPKELM